MMIGRDYLLKHSAGPSGPKLFLDTQVVPFATNIAGGLEVALERASVRSGVRPVVIVAAAGSLISLALLSLLRQRRSISGAL